MAIWNRSFSLETLNKMGKDTLLSTIGIEFTAMGDDFIEGKMPVDHRTVQPQRILHGGASVVLAESLGSIASYMVIDNEDQIGVGLEINANHIRPGIKGYVYGRAMPVHLGKTTHVWEVKITNEEGKLVCISRLTIAVKNIK